MSTASIGGFLFKFMIQLYCRNNERIVGTTVPYVSLMQGGTLFFNMTSELPMNQ